MTESEIAELCRQIYRTHKAAIDLIIAHMPDVQQEMAEYLSGLIRSNPSLVEVRFSKSYINFAPQEWQQRLEFNTGTGWGPSPAAMSFEFRNGSDYLSLHLILGPIMQEFERVRSTIFAHADAHRNVFAGCRHNLTSTWSTLYKMSILRKQDYEDASLKDLAEIIEPKWQHFVEHVLPQMNDQMMQIKFV